MAGRTSVAIALLLAAAPAASAAAPSNDDYLAAMAINSPGSAMPRDMVTTPATDTTGATLQGDLFSPPRVGGPPEPSICGSTALDHSVWYRFFPDTPGRIRLQAVGFDATVALVPFTSEADPRPQGYICANQREDMIESLDEPVEAGGSYAVQVGGAGGAAGMLQLTFAFLPDRDGDGVTDEQDQCPKRPGTVNGCPPQIHASIAYKFDGTANGVTFVFLRVKAAPRGATVEVRCTRGCSRQRLRVRSQVTAVRALRGRFFPSGTRIEVRVTKSGQIGQYRRLDVAPGDVTSTDRCMQPGSTVPRRSCK